MISASATPLIATAAFLVATSWPALTVKPRIAAASAEKRETSRASKGLHESCRRAL